MSRELCREKTVALLGLMMDSTAYISCGGQREALAYVEVSFAKQQHSFGQHVTTDDNHAVFGFDLRYGHMTADSMGIK